VFSLKIVVYLACHNNFGNIIIKKFDGKFLACNFLGLHLSNLFNLSMIVDSHYTIFKRQYIMQLYDYEMKSI
jgi:hypothetical protein